MLVLVAGRVRDQPQWDDVELTARVNAGRVG